MGENKKWVFLYNRKKISEIVEPFTQGITIYRVAATHPVDPGHDVPSTSVVAGHQQQQQTTGVSVASTINLPNLSSVNTLSGEPTGLSIGVLAPTGRNELSSAVAGATVGTTNTDNRGVTGPPSAPAPQPQPTASLLDPFRQAFLVAPILLH